MGYYVYVLKSKKHSGYYKGFTKDLGSRIRLHNSGKSKYTSSGIPWILVYYEKFSSKEEAIKREKYLKSAAGRRLLKSINLDQSVRVPSPRPTE